MPPSTVPSPNANRTLKPQASEVQNNEWTFFACVHQEQPSFVTDNTEARAWLLATTSLSYKIV